MAAGRQPELLGSSLTEHIDTLNAIAKFGKEIRGYGRQRNKERGGMGKGVELGGGFAPRPNGDR